MREWLKLMLEEIRRREAEEEAAAEDASGAEGHGPAAEPGNDGSDDGPSTRREGSAPSK